jgi:hypothetical protein
MRLSILLTVGILFLSIGPGRADNCNLQGGRQTLRFYEYQGTQTNEGKAGFGVFRKMIADEVVSANEYLLGISKLAAPVIDTEPNIDAPFAAGQLTPTTGATLFAGDRKLLEALDGFLLQRPGQGLFVVHSNIYLSPTFSAGVTPIAERSSGLSSASALASSLMRTIS